MAWDRRNRKPSKYELPYQVEARCSGCGRSCVVAGSAWTSCKGINDKPKCIYCAAPIYLADSKSVERYVGMTPLRRYFNSKEQKQ